MPSAGNSSAVISATLCLINEERRQVGLGALRENADLDQAAQSYTEDMIVGDFFSDVSPSGASVSGRVLETGYIPAGAGYALGENIGYGTGELATPAQMVAAWMASPPHRANILDRDFEETGIGVDSSTPDPLASGESGATYTQDFGSVLK